MIKFQCPHPDCQKTHSAPFDMAGRKFPCKGCGRRLQIPGRLRSEAEEERTYAGVQLPLNREMVHYTCPNCTRQGDVSKDYLNKTVRCRVCREQFTLTGTPIGGSSPETDWAPATLPPTDQRTIRSSAPPPTSPMPTPTSRPRKGNAAWRFIALIGLLLLCGSGAGAYYFIWGRPKPVTPPNPYYGLIEIGGKSIKALAIEVISTSDGLDWSILKLDGREQIDFDGINLAGEIKEDGSIPDNKFEALVAKLKEFAEKIMQQKVPPGQIYVVCSSGVLEALKGKPEALAKCKEMLAKAVHDAGGRDLDFLNERDEPRLAHVCCVPKAIRSSALLLDIGGGNTKGGYFDDQGQFYPLAMGLGSSLFEKEWKKKGGTPAAAEVLRKGKMTDTIKSATADSPGVRNRQKVYVIGGAAWGWTRFSRPESTGLRVELLPEDIDRYHALLYSSDDVQEIKKKALERVKDPAAREKASAELDKITSRLSLAYLRAGAEILMALKQELKLDNRELITFDKGNIAWPLGYLLEKAQQAR